ncbi:uncharacterized protein LOC113351875 [Papaver somniferum]|uniref:uncharacterized protein LOC113351875 n=1 Tax=Papaver somniferum TaxID=3469 RepID=UPI000E6FD942|nr:uncharacterized protein LOC113351875 [Papaver somniferum]
MEIDFFLRNPGILMVSAEAQPVKAWVSLLRGKDGLALGKDGGTEEVEGLKVDFGRMVGGGKGFEIYVSISLNESYCIAVVLRCWEIKLVGMLYGPSLQPPEQASKISLYTSRNPYALEEACTVWEGVLIDQKEESTSTDMPLGTDIHNIEITLGKGGQLAREAGVVAKLIAKEGKLATLKLPSGEVRLISKNCSETVGQVGNVGVNQKSLGTAGSKRWLGKCPEVRGVVMNPVDHPMGVVKEGPQLVENSPQPLGVILRLEEEVERGISIMIV